MIFSLSLSPPLWNIHTVIFSLSLSLPLWDCHAVSCAGTQSDAEKGDNALDRRECECMGQCFNLQTEECDLTRANRRSEHKEMVPVSRPEGQVSFCIFFFCTLPTNSSTDIRISHEEHMSHVRNRKEGRLMTEPHQLDPSEQNGSLFNHNTFRSAHTQTLLHTQTLGLKKQQIISCQQIWLQKYSGTTNAKLLRREQFCLNRLPNSRCSFLL